MRSPPIALASVTVSDTTLKAAPARLFMFLEGVADPAIFAQLARYGWSASRHAEAWALLTALRGSSSPTVAPAPARVGVETVGDAMRSCAAWQSGDMVRARALLELTHPAQAAFLFGDFVPGKGMAAVLNVMTFLDRRSMLSAGTGRKATRKADHEALALIEESGTTKETLKALAASIEDAQATAPPAPDAALAAEAAAKRMEILRKIHAWLSTWTEIARTVLGRRADQIRLGIAKRRSSSKAKLSVRESRS